MVKIALSEAATWGILYKKVFLKLNPQENTYASLFYNKFAGAAVNFTHPLNLKIFEHSL